VDTLNSVNKYFFLTTAGKRNKRLYYPKSLCLKFTVILLVLFFTHSILIHLSLAAQSSSVHNRIHYNTGKVSHDLSGFMKERDRDQRIRVLVKFKPSLIEEQASTPSNEKRLAKQRNRDGTARYRRAVSSNLSHLHSLLENRQKTAKNNRYDEKGSWLTNSIAVSLTPEEIAVLSNDPAIEKIVKKRPVILSIPQATALQGESSTPDNFWSFDTIGMQDIPFQDLNGNGIRIGHLDTGISAFAYNVASKVIDWAEFSNTGARVDSVPHETNASAHGTFTASILAGDTTGIAPGAHLLSALVLPEGYGTEEQILAGLEWVIDPNGDGKLDDGAQIINMSFGMPTSSEILDEAIKRIVSLGILPVCAIGNQGLFAVYFPGTMPEVIGVGATDQFDKVIPQSSGATIQNGEATIIKPDITAPGYLVIGLDGNGGYQTLSGTSVAAPQVAGAAALLLQQMPEQGIDDLKKFLLYSSRKVKESQKKDIRYGMGILNVAAASQFLDTYAPRKDTADLILKDPGMPNAFVNRLSTYFSNGSDQFLEEERLDSYLFYGFGAVEAHPIDMADVDGDGLADVIVRKKTMIDAATSKISYVVHTMAIDSGFARMGQTWYSFTQPNESEPEYLGMADVNGDGRGDLLIKERQENGITYQVIVHACLSNGRSFEKRESPWAEFSVSNYDNFSVDFGDMNGDGKADMAYWLTRAGYFNSFPTYYYTCLSDGSRFLYPVFARSIYYYNNIMSEHLALRDVNGDGAADLIMTEYSEYSSSDKLYVHVYLSDRTGKFKAKQLWGLLDWDEYSTIAGIEDVNSDNSADLIIRRFNQISGSCTFSAAKSNSHDKFIEDMEPWLVVPCDSEADAPEVIGVREVGWGDWVFY